MDGDGGTTSKAISHSMFVGVGEGSCHHQAILCFKSKEFLVLGAFGCEVEAMEFCECVQCSSFEKIPSFGLIALDSSIVAPRRKTWKDSSTVEHGRNC